MFCTVFNLFFHHKKHSDSLIISICYNYDVNYNNGKDNVCK